MKKRVLGYSLTEVLVSFLILSSVLVLFSTMQVASLKKMREAYFFSQAENQLNNLLNDPFLSLNEWNKQNKTTLPEGIGIKTQNKVSLVWNDKLGHCLDFSL